MFFLARHFIGAATQYSTPPGCHPRPRVGFHHSFANPILTTRPSGEACVGSYPRGSCANSAGRLSSTFNTPTRNEIPLNIDCDLPIAYDPCKSSVAQQPTRP